MMWMKIVAICVCTLLCAACITSNTFSQIRLNEILADPASDWDGDSSVSSRDDEWVEIMNAGPSAVDLSSLRLTDASGGYSWRFGFSGTLQPGAVLVVYGSEALLWQRDNGFPAQGLSLNNSGDQVLLYDVSGVDTTVVDEYTYEDHEVVDDRATGRYPDGSGQWVIFDALNPYAGADPPFGSGCMPSPGALNTCPALPTETSTWGVVKDRYK
jgi:hypothetical protein